MNNIQMITLKVLRCYSSKRVSKFAGIRGKLKLTELDHANVNPEQFDVDDIGVYDSDLHEICEPYVNRKQITRKDREKLKQRIVRSKYFKETEPRFITYVEKDQIKKLHQSDPDEWTPEKLSESFPILPDSVRKILKSEWVPDSVECIVKYDTKAIENWKSFRTGKLAVSPHLREHLMKFGNRNISLSDREMLASNFVRQRVEIPKPVSTFFSSIIQSPSKEKEEIADAKKKTKLLTSPQYNPYSNAETLNSVKNRPTKLAVREEDNVRHSDRQNTAKFIHEQEKLHFGEFLKSKLNNLDQVMPEERVTLLHMYRKHVETTNAKGAVSISSGKESTADKDKGTSFQKLYAEGALIVQKQAVESHIVANRDTKCISLDTYVKEKKSMAESNVDYIYRIKIPKNVYQKGMTYKISDCYYDDDGEFLYRVPGLKRC